jgi:cytidylate kinase
MTVIAIDGPAGSGKSTIARRLAERLGLPYLDTGAMYRAVAWAALRDGCDPYDADAVAALAAKMQIDVEDGRVDVDGEDASRAIRGPAVNRTVSAVAAHPGVRAEMVRRQRDWIAGHGGGVVEGRDIGTVVLPDADLKVFLTARLEVRAARRHGELVDEQRLEDVQADMAKRDTLDSGRAVSPLERASDAVEVDTSDRTVEDVVEELMARLAP